MAGGTGGPGGVEDPSSASGATAAIAGGELLGRDRELAELEAAFAEAVAGRGQLCLLAGEPGIGKTSLADAVARRAATSGAEVRWGRAWEGGGAPALWPWVQVLRGLCGEHDAETLRAELGAGAQWVAQIVPEVAEALPDVEPPRSVETQEARFALFDAVASFLRNLARKRTLTLVLDDLHVADTATVLLLEFVARSIRDAPILLVATYQDAATRARPEIDANLADLAREGRRIMVRRLGAEDIARLIQQQGGAAPAAELVSELQARTEGNPFFAHEVVRLLAVQGQLELQAGGELRARFPLPESVREAVRQRLRPLGDRTLGVLSLASVVGRDFQVSVVERLADVPRGELIDLIDQAVTTGVVGEDPAAPGRFTFAHGLIRETLYEGLPPARRIAEHGRLGEILEQAYAPDIDPHLAELAHHFLRAAPGGYAAKAVDYAARAGARAMAHLAYEEAERLYEGALHALELLPADPERRADLLLCTGRAQVRAGDEAARETLRAAAAIARTLDRPDVIAEAAIGFRAFPRSPGLVDEEVIALFEEALQGLGPDQAALRARVLVRLAVQIFDRPDSEARRRELVEEAIALAREVGDRPTLGYVLSNAQLATWGPDTREEALEWSREILPIAREIGDSALELTTYSRDTDFLLELDDLPGADRAIEALAGVVAEVPEPRGRAYLALHRSRRLAMEGRFEEAETLTEEATRLGERVGDRAIGMMVAAQQWGLSWSTGRIGELEPLARMIAARAPSVRAWRAGLTLVYCRQGRDAEARAEFEAQAGKGFAEIARNDNWMIGMTVLCEVAEHLGDEARARTLYDLLSPFDGRNVLSYHGLYAGPVARYLGLMAGTFGDLDRALEHLDAARSTASRSRARPALAVIALDEARIRLRREERERAAELVAEGSELAREVAATGLVSVAESLAATTGEAAGQRGAPAAQPEDARLRREGDVWMFDYGGRSVRVRDSKGVQHLAQLLAAPGVEVHALDLVGAGEVSSAGAAAAADAGLETRATGEDAPGPALDAEAKAAYKSRLDELREEVEEAESFNDPERASRAREEMDFIAQELAGAVGLGGRDRKTGSAAERARVNATRSIRSALKRIAEYDEALGRELESTVRTGVFCAYEPDPRRPVTWTVDAG